MDAAAMRARVATLGLSQVGCARLIGCDPRMFRRYLSGATEAPAWLPRMLALLDLPQAEMLLRGFLAAEDDLAAGGGFQRMVEALEATPEQAAQRSRDYPPCVDPMACVSNGWRCPRDPVCGN